MHIKWKNNSGICWKWLITSQMSLRIWTYSTCHSKVTLHSSALHSFASKFYLKNVFQCLKLVVNLLTIQKFCLDIDSYFILISFYFFAKDTRTHVKRLEGKSENSFYPLRLQRNSLRNKWLFTASLGIKTTLALGLAL